MFDSRQGDQFYPRSSVNRTRVYETRGRRLNSFRGCQHNTERWPSGQRRSPAKRESMRNGHLGPNPSLSAKNNGAFA